MKASVRRLGHDEPQDGVSELRRVAFPNFVEARDVRFYEGLYRWYREHPLAEQMYRWISVNEEGRVIGHLAAFPQYYRINGERVVAHTPGDYMVLEGYSFQAFSLMRNFFRNTDNCVACDMVPAVISVETRLGAEVAGQLQYAAKLLNVSRLPTPTVPGRLRRLLRLPENFGPARGYGGHSPSTVAEEPDEAEAPPVRPRAPLPAPVKNLLNQGLGALDGALGRGYGRGIEVEELDGFDESFDELFEKVAAVVPCAPEKNSAFLNWRYGPDSPQHPVRVLGARSGQRLLGYAVLKTTSVGEDGFVLDLTTLPGHQEAGRALLRESVRYLRDEGVHIIRYRFLESPTSLHTADLWRIGFFYRGENRRNSLLVKFVDGESHKLACDLGNWTYNVGDGEATFWIR